jgi:hypothetical protein
MIGEITCCRIHDVRLSELLSINIALAWGVERVGEGL